MIIPTFCNYHGLPQDITWVVYKAYITQSRTTTPSHVWSCTSNNIYGLKHRFTGTPANYYNRATIMDILKCVYEPLRCLCVCTPPPSSSPAFSICICNTGGQEYMESVWYWYTHSVVHSFVHIWVHWHYDWKFQRVYVSCSTCNHLTTIGVMYLNFKCVEE